tara:strand:- start:1415 stop:1528 length:114 start_codon:yes stop_codon:yes gene_type:complete
MNAEQLEQEIMEKYAMNGLAPPEALIDAMRNAKQAAL